MLDQQIASNLCILNLRADLSPALAEDLPMSSDWWRIPRSQMTSFISIPSCLCGMGGVPGGPELLVCGTLFNY